jgi:hypothetical protein
VTRLRAGRQGFVSGQDWRRKFFLIASASEEALGPIQPLILCVPTACFFWVKRPGLEGDQSSSCTAEVKNAWSCTSTPPCLRGVVLNEVHDTSSWRGTWLNTGIPLLTYILTYVNILAVYVT